MLIINFKTYQQAVGENAMSLVNILNGFISSGPPLIACPQAVDLARAVKISSFPIYTQHLDAQPRGRATGWFPPEVAAEIGVKGTLLHHSEHKLDFSTLKNTVSRCRRLNLKILIFADSLAEAQKVAALKPDFIGYEPPELVASKTTSVSRSKPDIIERVAASITEIPVLIGAGVKERDDVKIGLQRGAKGVVVSSDIVLSPNPEREIADLLEGFK